MRPKVGLFWVAVAVAGSAATLLTGSVPTSAADTPFDFRVDRFEIEMAADARGIPDFVDEFDRPLVNDWFTQFGTAFAADGFLHLASPGTEVPNGFGILPGTTLHLSLVGSVRQAFDGEGSFVARSYWEPDELAAGDFNHMSLSTVGGGPMEVGGLAIMNTTKDGEPTVYTIVQHLVRFAAATPGPPQLATVTIDPSAITGQVVFEFRFDDAANTLGTAFSLDGGATFERPFPPIPIFDGTYYSYFLLGADPLIDTVRAHLPPPPLCASALIGDAKVVSRARGRSTIAVLGSIAQIRLGRRHYDPRRDGVAIRIVDRSIPETPILDLTATAILPGGPGCGSRDGWRRVGNGFTYRNETNALPPACIPGSAGGLTRMRLRKVSAARSGIRYAIDLATEWHPVSPARIATTLVLGDAMGSSAGIACGTFEVRCVTGGASVRCE